MNKVQKIREEVERLMNELIREKEKGFGSDTDDACILELQNVLTYIDSLQEEHVSKRFTFKAIPRLLEMIEPTDRAKAYIAKLADTLELEGYSTDAKIVMESLKIMNGEKVAMATMDEEPVSEELEVELKNYINSDEYINTLGVSGYLLIARHFANWQKNKMMEDAVDGEVGYWNQRGLSVNMDLPRTLEEDDKVKLVIIKEDKV